MPSNTVEEAAELLPYAANARQTKILEAVIAHGSQRKAATALDLAQSGVSTAITAVKLQAARAGFAPGHFEDGVAPGFKMGKVTVQRDGEGNVERTWERQSPEDASRVAALRAAVEGLCEGLHSLVPLVDAPRHTDSDLLAVYPIGDPHFGMYSWAEETGDDFDLDIAERLTVSAVDRLIASAPAAETGLFINLGDALHADSQSNATPTSGALLDVDGRAAKVAAVAVKTMVHCIRRLLEKHKTVIVWNLPGNHDPNSALWLAICIQQAFAGNPRVIVELNPSLFRYHLFGKVLIGAHHGHGAKANDLPLLMATDRQHDWAASDFRHWMCGHIHHYTAKEHPGCTVETFRTLAAKDAWHAGKGYRSGRDMNCITYHRDHGEIQRTRCDLSMLAA